jgi:hypothetical protein
MCQLSSSVPFETNPNQLRAMPLMNQLSPNQRSSMCLQSKSHQRPMREILSMRGKIASHKMQFQPHQCPALLQMFPSTGNVSTAGSCPVNQQTLNDICAMVGTPVSRPQWPVLNVQQAGRCWVPEAPQWQIPRPIKAGAQHGQHKSRTSFVPVLRVCSVEGCS